MRDALPRAELLPKSFSKAGYWSGGSRCSTISSTLPPGTVLPSQRNGKPFSEDPWTAQASVSFAEGRSWQYYETDWGPIDGTDENMEEIMRLPNGWTNAFGKREQPFFLACGLYRPHEPWFVPRKYFEAFPLYEIQLPPGLPPE